MSLRIATFNIRNGRAVQDGRNAWWLRRRATVDVIAGLGGDVVALQEAYRFQLRYLLRSLPQFDAAGAGRDDGHRRGEHAPVLFRRDRFVLQRCDTRWLSDTPEVPGSRTWGNRLARIATMAWLQERRTGKLLGVVNAHLDAESPEVRRRSAAAILDWAGREGDRPWVVVGDLNATPGEPSIRALVAAGYHDALGHLPDGGKRGATAHGFSESGEGPRIDYVLVPGPLLVASARIVRRRPGGRFPSDHWPVVADLER